MANKKRKPTVYSLSSKNESPATAGKNYPASARIPSIDEIYDDSTESNRMIRYVVGEQSVYEDEQTTENPIIGDVVFTNGILTVPFNQVNLRKYLDACNYNEDNPDRIDTVKALFSKVNTEFDAEKSMKSLETEYLATDTLMKMNAQEMVGYARAMGLDVDRSMYEIKHDMMVMAKGNPELFMEEISNPMIERKQIIMDALDDKFIYENKGKRQFYWTDTKELIFTVPVGISPLDALTEYTFDEEGTAVFSRIKRMLSGEKEQVKSVKKESKKVKA
jgi:hypothetical protein